MVAVLSVERLARSWLEREFRHLRCEIVEQIVRAEGRTRGVGKIGCDAVPFRRRRQTEHTCAFDEILPTRRREFDLVVAELVRVMRVIAIHFAFEIEREWRRAPLFDVERQRDAIFLCGLRLGKRSGNRAWCGCECARRTWCLTTMVLMLARRPKPVIARRSADEAIACGRRLQSQSGSIRGAWRTRLLRRQTSSQ